VTASAGAITSPARHRLKANRVQTREKSVVLFASGYM
jgi:hypothetical protein